MIFVRFWERFENFIFWKINKMFSLRNIARSGSTIVRHLRTGSRDIPPTKEIQRVVGKEIKKQTNDREPQRELVVHFAGIAVATGIIAASFIVFADFVHFLRYCC